ncbi:hypothetical protein H6P81_015305 [Aristolochia fimbriata]|uniref:Uncharacterized protein n=1 Tax=Aristolochia fimbriata TaxID=158543 RepID=A0AAV7E784_ARIFI|nr:hypothetical protein H6P81_015305 [Aristolochia fimbriata]
MSSSRSRVVVVGNEEEEEGWLRLGLGPVRGDASGLRAGQQELGLGLAFGNDGGLLCTEPPPSLLTYHHDQRWLHPPPLLPGSSSSSSSSSTSSPSPATLPSLWSSSPLLWPLHGGDQYFPAASTQKREVGVWFSLRSCNSRDWNKEALPQVPKAYIRVKDESATVLMVKNYLVRKLGLSSELEIDITCMGNRLLPTQTLKYVRDEVWLPSLIGSFAGMASRGSEYPSLDHYLMSLHYKRSCCST